MAAYLHAQLWPAGGARGRLCGSAYFCPSFKEPLSSSLLSFCSSCHSIPLWVVLSVTVMSSLFSLNINSARWVCSFFNWMNVDYLAVLKPA